MFAEALPPGGASAPDGPPKVEAATALARPAATAAAALGADGGGPFDDGRPLSVGGDDGGVGGAVLVLLLALAGPVALVGDGPGAVDVLAGVGAGAAAVGALAGLGRDVVPVLLLVGAEAFVGAEEFVGVVVVGRDFGVAPSAVVVACAAPGGDAAGDVDAPAGGDAVGGGAALALSLVVEFVGIVVAGRSLEAASSAVVVARAALGDVLGAGDVPAGGDEGADAADMLLGGPAGARDDRASCPAEGAAGAAAASGVVDPGDGVEVCVAGSDDSGAGLGDTTSAGRE